MREHLSDAEQLAYSTVRIEAELPNGGRGTGTGFFFILGQQPDGTHSPVIITNRHVVAGAVKLKFCLTLAKPGGGPDRCNHAWFGVNRVEQLCFPHPDGETDLCCIPLAPLLKQAEERGQSPFFVTLCAGNLPSEAELNDITGLEEIVMVGYPNGIWDKVNNMPVFRRGITASHLHYDWNGRSEFLIDAACFPGSSGSPVFLFDQNGYRTRRTISLGTRCRLIGVLYAGPQHSVTGEIDFVTLPTAQVPVALSRIPNNLGFVIKAHKLLDFEALVPRTPGEH